MHDSYLHIDLFTDLGLWGFSYQFSPWLAEEVRLLCQARCQRRGRMEKKGGWRRERKWFVQIASVRQRKSSAARSKPTSFYLGSQPSNKRLFDFDHSKYQAFS